MGKGLFISFEGVEGTGKTTQARLLFEHLKDKGREAVLTKEPGGTAIGARIREVLLSEEHSKMGDLTELLLYCADRAQHVRELINPALEAGGVVITDRYSDSTRAYQGAARGLEPELLAALDSAATGGLLPDVTLLLDLEPSEGLRRNREAQKSDRLEQEALEFHERVREAFLDIARHEPGRVKLLDASGTVDEVHARVLAALGGLLRL